MRVCLCVCVCVCVCVFVRLCVYIQTMWIMTASPACSRTVINFSDSMVQLAKVIASVLMLSAGICQHKREREGGGREKEGGEKDGGEKEGEGWERERERERERE